MYHQLGRLDRTRREGLAPDAVTALLAALGFMFAVLWPIVGPQLHLLQGPFGETIVFADPPSPAHAAAQPVAAPATPLEPAHAAVAGNAAPVIDSVTIRGDAVTAAADLRLDVSAVDADSDPVRLRTRWTIGERDLETSSAVLPRTEIRRGDRIRAVVFATDGESESAPFALPAIHVGNAVPAITSFPQGFEPSGAFAYPVAAADADGDAEFEVRLVRGPAGMVLVQETLRWTPGSDQNGTHTVEVEVRDGRGGVARQTFDLNVRARRPDRSSLAQREDLR
jgi:hypothetical protein